MRWWDEECFEEFDLADPLQHERIVPVEDDEADRMEELCRAATPGPLVIDDRSEGGGALIATLPDGRSIVSQCAGVVGEEESQAAIEANAQLVCRARCMVLRMIHDRRHWRQREQELLGRVEQLEGELERARTEAGPVAVAAEDGPPRRPR
jgi:hypothetical protein